MDQLGRSISWFASAGFAAVAAVSAYPAYADDCTSDVLSVGTQIESIRPEGATAIARRADGSERPVRALSCLHRGEQLVIPVNVQQITVLDVDRRVLLRQGGAPFTVRSGYTSALTSVGQYIDRVFRSFSPNEPYLPGGIRGSKRLQHIGILAPGSEMQSVTPSLSGGHIVTAWSGGIQPWACITDTFDVSSLGTTSQPAPDYTYCEISVSTSATQILVQDGIGIKIAFSFRQVPARSIPRPKWIAEDVSKLSVTEQVGWALWLMDEAPAEWKLQALAMLASVRRDSWAANYVFLGFVKGELGASEPLRTP